MTDLTLKPTAAPLPTRPATDPAPAGWGGDGFGFNDFLDLINPLQHVPGVSTLYRAVTGDAIADEARFIGHIVYGGPLGLIAATAETLATDRDGRGLSENLAAWWGGEAETAVAARRPDPPPPCMRPETAPQPERPPPTAPWRRHRPPPQKRRRPDRRVRGFAAGQGRPFGCFHPTPKQRPGGHLEDPRGGGGRALAPPPTAGGADGAQLAQWMMQALDRYRQQAGQR